MASAVGGWLLLVGLGLIWSSVVAAATTCPRVQLCVVVDGSGSIASSDFDLMKNGFAGAIRDPSIVPRDGSVSLAFVQLGVSGNAQVEVPLTLINSDAVANNVANQLQAISQGNGGTPMDAAIDLCASTLVTSCASGIQVINIVTDGGPDSQTAAVAARDRAVAAGVDQLNAEAVAAPDYAFNFLRDQLVYPQPGYEAPPFLSNGGGFVIKTATFEDFEVAVRGKLGQIVGPTSGCTIEPASAHNPPGTSHMVTVTVKKDGTPQANVSVTVSVTAGPNAGRTVTKTTRADGTLDMTYTSNGASGTDTIQAIGMLDSPFSCTATKIWDPPTCTIDPASETHQVGEQQSMIVTVNRADGTVAAGASVTVDIVSGPNSPDTGTFTAGSGGQVQVYYTGSAGVGTDTITAHGTIGGAAFSCNATVTWTAPHPVCTFTPPSATESINTQHSMVLLVTYGGVAKAYVPVTVSIVSGPNSPDSGSGQTDNTGKLNVLYTGSHGTGTDTVQASGTYNGEYFSCQATVTWVVPPPVCTISPSSSTGPAVDGATHNVTVTVSRSGVALGGVAVTFTLVSGPNAPDSGAGATNSYGELYVSYTSNGVAGTDSFTASGTYGGVPFSCNGTRQWLALTATPTRTWTATPTWTRSVTPTRTFTPTPTFSMTRTQTATRTAPATQTPSRTGTSTRTASATPSPSPTQTRQGKPTFTPTASFSPPPTETPTQTEAPTQTRTVTRPPTMTLTATPSSTVAPSSSPSRTPTISPTETLLPTGTKTVTASPTATPTTPAPSASPSPTLTASRTPSATATAVSKASFTPTTTGTATATATASPTFAASIPPTPSVTSTPGGCTCVGDCDCSGEVTVDEMITMVRIGLEEVGVMACPAGDSDGSGTITIDEILTAINNGLYGCPP